MDTISSREPSGSPLPLVGVIAGVIGLVLGIVAVVKVSTVNKRLEEEVKPKIDMVDGIKATADAASESATKVTREAATLRQSLVGLNKDISEYLGGLRADVDALKEAQKKAPVAAATKGGAPAVAGPGEYVVKAGDTSGTKIARANNVSIQDLQTVNPGVDWSKLKIGQKLKLPKK